jgi:hypothetical protein
VFTRARHKILVAKNGEGVMEPRREVNESQLSVEERRLRLDKKRLLLENSFARKWLPTLVTLMVGLIATMFSYVQQQIAIQATERARIEA